MSPAISYVENGNQNGNHNRIGNVIDNNKIIHFNAMKNNQPHKRTVIMNTTNKQCR